jgi:AICAR transformylase/IMP cyclohydrolase PurH
MFLLILLSWATPTLSSPIPLFTSQYQYVATPTYTNKSDTTTSSQIVNKLQRSVAKPKWVNPCGLPSSMQHMAHALRNTYDVTPLSDSELLHNVVLAAKNALKHSRFFKEDYVSLMFFF